MAESLVTQLSSATQSMSIDRRRGTTLIGERINPTGRKAVLSALQSGDFALVRQDALAQVRAGAHVLDVNAGVPGADEVDLLPRVVREVMDAVDVPLSIDSNNPRALAAALAVYPGKALVNSVNGEEKMLSAILPLVKEHGAAVVALCMDAAGIPGSAEARLRVASQIVNRALALDIALADIVLDPLVLALGTDHEAGRVALETIDRVVAEFGVNVTMGTSNASFGLPDRNALNATFIAMAIHAGVSCPIANPLAPAVRKAILAADLALGRDEYAMNWIRAYRAHHKRKPTLAQ